MESGNNNGGNNGWNQGGWNQGGWNMGCMGMKMNYYNEPTWDAEIEHLRKYPPPIGFQPHLSVTRLNSYTVAGNKITVQSVDGGLFRLVALNGKTLFQKQISSGTQSFQIPRTAQNQHWIATLNGKMISK